MTYNMSKARKLEECVLLKMKTSEVWVIDEKKFIDVVKKLNTKGEILDFFGLKKHGGNFNQLNERIKYLNLDISHLGKGIVKKKRSPIWKIEEKEFISIIEKSKTTTDALSHFGLKNHGGNFRTLNERVKALKLDISHFEKGRYERMLVGLSKMRKEIPLQELLVENSSYNRTNLKRRLLKAGLLEEKCYECGLGATWNGKPLKLQLEHKNGVNDDNRLENLCLLCPNCHSQTETYAGRMFRKFYYCKDEKCGRQIVKQSKSGYCANCVVKSRNNFKQTKVKNRPSRNELLNLILNQPFTKIGKMYGVSDTAIRKWCKSYDLPHRSRDIKAQKDELLKELEISIIED